MGGWGVEEAPYDSSSSRGGWVVVGLVLLLSAAGVYYATWGRGGAEENPGPSSLTIPPISDAARPSLARGRAAFRLDTEEGYATARDAYDQAASLGGGVEARALAIEAEAWRVRLAVTPLDPARLGEARALVREWPGSPAARRALATALLVAGQKDSARDLLSKAVDDFPDDPGIFLLLGMCSDASGNAPAVSIAHLRRALELDPDLLAARTSLASLYARTGLKAESRAERARVLASSPQHRMKEKP